MIFIDKKNESTQDSDAELDERSSPRATRRRATGV